MIEFLGEHYYIDVDEFERQVSYESSVLQAKPKTEDGTEDTDEMGFDDRHISVSRFEAFKNLIDVVLTERDTVDESLGHHGLKDLTIPFKLSFNTLLINKIIKKM